MIASKLMVGTKINAAFLQEVKDANVNFWSNIRDLRNLIVEGQATRDDGLRLVKLLGELRTSLATEFSLEETYGYITGMRPSAIDAESKAAKARQQHRDLYLGLHEICELAEEAEYRGTIVDELPAFYHRCETFLTDLDLHESFESEIVRDSFVSSVLRK